MAWLLSLSVSRPAPADDAPPQSDLALLSGSHNTPADEWRYTGEFSDGHRQIDVPLTEWGNGNQPKLGGKPLFDQASPIRWLRKGGAEQITTQPAAFVEFVGGDVLPGRVLGTGPTTTLQQGELPAHLLVEPATPVNWPENPGRNIIRVASRWLKRVVWQRRVADDYQPGTLFLKDGRQLAFRSVRLDSSAVSVLTDTERRQIPFGELAEIDMPAIDWWNAYFEQLAVLAPDLKLRLMRLETNDGLRATTSADRFQPTFYGDPNNPEHWYQMVQPAWALDPLFVRHRRVLMRRFYGPHEVPLSLVEPNQVKLRSALAVGWRPRADRNVQGGTLESGGKQFGWGWGLQAYTEMYFPLPACAESFQSQIGLDRIVGSGGCARAIVYADKTTNSPLFRGELLIGSDKLQDTGALHFDAAGGGHQLVLVAHPAHGDRPPGADPLDIRDVVDWLEPQLNLNLDKLHAEVRSRLVGLVSGLDGWTIAPGDENQMIFANRFDPSGPRDRRFRFEFRPQAAAVTLKRELHIEPEQNWLLLYVSRIGDNPTTTPTQAIVKINGQQVGDFDVPGNWGGVDPQPLIVPVDSLHDKQVNLEVRLVSRGDKSWVDWRSMALVERLPTLAEVFEDSAQPPLRFTGTATAEIATFDRYSGTASIKVTGPDAAGALTNLNLPISENPRFGEYRYIRFAWRKKAGREIALDLTFDVPPDGNLTTTGIHKHIHGVKSPNSVLDRAAGSRDPNTRKGNMAVALDEIAATGGNQAALEQLRLRYFFGPRDVALDNARSIQFGDRAPEQWNVVVRDLAQDLRDPNQGFGGAQLTSITLTCPDGDYALLDHIYLARTPQDFDRCPPQAPPLVIGK